MPPRIREADRASDEAFMRRALTLARRGRGSVEPNPMVGCVLSRNGRIIGEGNHQRFGGPHAEVHALRSVAGSARGATAYVTLEPCCHFGKTPPCTTALIEAGIRRVVFAVEDPFPKVHGQGARLLHSAGITVERGHCAAEAALLMAPYLKLQSMGQPWVILKWAQSLDGKIATSAGDSKWISGEVSRRWVHGVRSWVDAIVVGVSTVVHDDPDLTCRGMRVKRVATRIVLDPTLRTPTSCRLVQTARTTPTLLIARKGGYAASRVKKLTAAGAEILDCPGKDASLDLSALLKLLGERGMSNILVEGGGRTHGAFHDEGLADEIHAFVSPRIIGGKSAPSAVEGRGIPAMAEARPVLACDIRRSGPDCHYAMRLTDPARWLSGSDSASHRTKRSRGS